MSRLAIASVGFVDLLESLMLELRAAATGVGLSVL